MSIHRTIITDACIHVFKLSESDMLKMDVTAISLRTLEYRAIAPKAESSKDNAATKIEGSLGSISILPSEIITMVMNEINLRSLAAFRDVNRFAREMTDTMTKFRAVYDQAPLLLRAAIKLNPPLPISIATLDAVLLDDTCSCCGIQDGSMISLLNCRRYCEVCFRRTDDQDPCIWCDGDPNVWEY